MATQMGKSKNSSVGNSNGGNLPLPICGGYEVMKMCVTLREGPGNVEIGTWMMWKVVSFSYGMTNWKCSLREKDFPQILIMLDLLLAAIVLDDYIISKKNWKDFGKNVDKK